MDKKWQLQQRVTTRVSAGSPWCSLGGSITRLDKSCSGQFLRGVILSQVLKAASSQQMEGNVKGRRTRNGRWWPRFWDVHFFNSGCMLEAPGGLGNNSVCTHPRPNQSEHHLLVLVQWLSHVGLFVTPRTVACQAPLSIGYPRQEYWSGLPFSSPGIFPIQGLKPNVLTVRYLTESFK